MEHQSEMTLYRPPPSKQNISNLKKGQWIYSESFIYGTDKAPRKWLITFVDSEIICICIHSYNNSIPLRHFEYKYHKFQVVDENFKPNLN
jgi:hypothetical protein